MGPGVSMQRPPGGWHGAPQGPRTNHYPWAAHPAPHSRPTASMQGPDLPMVGRAGVWQSQVQPCQRYIPLGRSQTVT